MKKKRINKHYRPYSFRLNEKTVSGLIKIKGGLSWNKFFLGIVREKEGKKCYFCGSIHNLEEHHIIAKKDGGSDKKSNIMLLCVSCHRKTENWGNKKFKTHK